MAAPTVLRHTGVLSCLTPQPDGSTGRCFICGSVPSACMCLAITKLVQMYCISVRLRALTVAGCVPWETGSELEVSMGY